jgi:pyruvate,water dikinase
MTQYTQWFRELGMHDVSRVGGKNASLGEMIQNLSTAGIRVPDGFATTAEAFCEHLAASGLDQRIQQRIQGLDIENMRELAACGKDIRTWIVDTPLSGALTQAIENDWQILAEGTSGELSVAVRSSATAEDLP